jgi:hypothetical protein
MPKPKRKEKTMNQKKEPVKPVHEVRLGKIRASVWGNRTNGVTWYSITLSRLYKDKEGNFQQAESFGPEDLPAVYTIAEELLRWYLNLKTRADTAEGDPPEGALA